jgi:hypothetical protein
MMKRMHIHWQTSLLAVAMTALVAGCGQGPEVAQADYEKQLRLEEEARAKDPAWKPSHSEVAVIKVGKDSKAVLNNFCLDRSGNVLACLQSQAAGKHAVEVYSPEGKLATTWPVEAAPEAICLDKDGAVLVAGGGRIQRFDSAGKVLTSAKTPAADAPLPPDEDLNELAKRFGDGSSEARLKQLKTFLTNRRVQVTGLAVSGDDIFIACPSTKDWSYCVYRIDRNFQNPKLIVEKLGGCCGQMDIQARDGKLWVAFNGRHRVQCHDRDGKLLSSFGKEDRKAADGFGGCCEPKNLRLVANGEVLAAESGPPVAVKRFTAEGKFLGVVAVPTFKMGCVRTTVDVSPDGQRYYVLNGEERAIHVFAAKN